MYISKIKNKLTKEVLYNLYCNKKLTQKQIAVKFFVSQSAINQYMKKYKIKRRPYGYHAIKHGKTQLKVYCVDCKIEISDYRHKRCLKCANIGKQNPMYNKKPHNYKGGITEKTYYCIDCNNKIHFATFLYNGKRCPKCSKSMNNHSNWKGGKPKCIDCGKELKSYIAKRCEKCYGKQISLFRSGKNSPMYGKKTYHSRYFLYKNRWFHSSWEAKFAYFLDCSNIKWKYEPKAYDLIINNKETTYTPDFYLPEFDCWIEIKGWWRDDALIKYTTWVKDYRLNNRVFYQLELQTIGVL